MVMFLGFGYDVEGLTRVLPPIEKHLLNSYVTSFHTMSRWRHDTHPHQTGISSGICPKRACIMIPSSSWFLRLNICVLCASTAICVYCVEL